jgi:conjugal transfer pilin signal peptidase TrbI
MQTPLRTLPWSLKEKFLRRKIGRLEQAGVVVLLSLLLFVIGASSQDRYGLVFQTDYSVRFRLGYIDRRIKLPAVGKYFAFTFLAVRDEPRYGRPFVKLLACSPGDRLENRGRDFYCNGKYIGTAKTHSLKGEPLSHFQFNGAIPPGHYFAVGETRDSFDSKYWGFVKADWILGTVKRII